MSQPNSNETDKKKKQPMLITPQHYANLVSNDNNNSQLNSNSKTPTLDTKDEKSNKTEAQSIPSKSPSQNQNISERGMSDFNQINSIPISRVESRDMDKDRELRQKYEEIIEYGNQHPESLDQNLLLLRKLILLEGLPSETEEEKRNSGKECSLRGKVWKILLRVKNIDANNYISLVEKGSAQNKLYQKIRNDTFRTFKTNRIFIARVPEEKQIRLLNAFIHSCGSITRISYVQGMNVVCAPFLYVMPELDAFYAFSQFVKVHCPLYFNPGIEGAYTGLQLLDEILKIVDYELYSHLISKNLKADVYAMPPILSFSASSPPLEELLKLWDFMIAFGPHLNVVSVAAQIVLIRAELLAAEQPNALLRTLPPLESNEIITLSVHLVRQLPDSLYQQLVTHPYQSRKARKYNTLPKSFKSGSVEVNPTSSNDVNINKRAIILNDVDNDGENELVIGSTGGLLVVYKLTADLNNTNIILSNDISSNCNKKPWRISSFLGTIICLEVGCFQKSKGTKKEEEGEEKLVFVLNSEGYLHIFTSISFVTPSVQSSESLLGNQSSVTPSIIPSCSQKVPANAISVVYGDIDNDGKKEVLIATSDGFIFSYLLEISTDQEIALSLNNSNNNSIHFSPRSISPSTSTDTTITDTSYHRVTNILRNVLELIKQYSSNSSNTNSNNNNNNSNTNSNNNNNNSSNTNSNNNNNNSNSQTPSESVNSNINLSGDINTSNNNISSISTSNSLESCNVLFDENKLVEISKSQQFKEIDKGIKELANIEMLHLLSSSTSIFSEKLAFFLNLHNLLTLHAIIYQGFPPFIKRYNFAKKAVYNIGGYYFSLLDIEHAVLRASSSSFGIFGSFILPKFKSDDPRFLFGIRSSENTTSDSSSSSSSVITSSIFDARINFAISWGTVSSARIFVFSNIPTILNSQLEIATETYIRQHVHFSYSSDYITSSSSSSSVETISADPIKSSTDSSTNLEKYSGVAITITQASLPKIMEWYNHDFGKTKVDLINWILRYYFLSSDKLKPFFTIKEDISVIFEKFNWDFQIVIAGDYSVSKPTKPTPTITQSSGGGSAEGIKSTVLPATFQIKKTWNLFEEITSMYLTLDDSGFPQLVVGHFAQICTIIDHQGIVQTLKFEIGEEGENQHPSFYSQDIICFTSNNNNNNNTKYPRIVTCSGGSLSLFNITKEDRVALELEQQWEICVPEELFIVKETTITNISSSQTTSLILACSWDGILYITYPDQKNKPKVVKYAFEDRVRAFTVGTIGVPSSAIPIDYDLNKPKEVDQKRYLNRNSNCLVFVSHGGDIHILLDFNSKLPNISSPQTLTYIMEDDLPKFHVISEFFSQSNLSNSSKDKKQDERLRLEKCRLYHSCLYTEFDAQAIQAYKASLLATLSKVSKENQRYSNDKPP